MPTKKTLKINRLHSDAVIPSYAKDGDAGMDLYSIDEMELRPGCRGLIKTGISIELPKGTEAQIRPRSGLALKMGITVLNTPGTIDCGYRGEIGVILINHGEENFLVKKGERIAQMVINKVESVNIEEVEELSETERGSGGFGSTGK